MTKKYLIDFLQSDDASSIAIENEKISLSGNENPVHHSSIFKQYFDEEVCKEMCSYFEFFNNNTSSDARTYLLKGINKMFAGSKGYAEATVECFLYATRVANSKIVNDSALFDDLSQIICEIYDSNPELGFEGVKHVFEVWNWDCQAGLALVGSIIAEKNPIKRLDLLKKMDEYINKHGDKSHRLLLYKVKAMVNRDSDYCEKIFNVLCNLDHTNNADSEIANIIKRNASEIFRGNDELFNNVRVSDVLARSTIKDIKQSLGFNEIDDIQNEIKKGNEDETTRQKIKQLMSRTNTNVERYCGIIRNHKLLNYLNVFDDLLEGQLNIHNKCCISLTYAQLVKGNYGRFNEFLENGDFPEDFKCLLRYVYNSTRKLPDYDNLDESTQFYFNDECSTLLKKGIKHTTKYDVIVAESVLDAFGYALNDDKENTPSFILEKFDNLLTDEKSKVRELVTSEATFLAEFNKFLKNDDIDLDKNPDFFDEMIDIIHHCPPTATKGFYYDIFIKTKDENRKERVREMMGDIDVAK